MDKFWSWVEVWAPTTADVSGYDCEVDLPDYGPHRRREIDRSDHQPTYHGLRNVGKLKDLPWVTCSCGWSGHALNYQQEHIDTLKLRTVWAYS